MFQILVVEDDLDLQYLFKQSLEKEGYEVITAEDADRALDELDHNRVDLIISDVMMPGMNGFEFIKEIRLAKMDIPVLIITAKGELKDIQSGFEVGTDDYMVKPIIISEMLLRVKALLRRYKSVSDRRIQIGTTFLNFDDLTVQSGEEIQILPQKEFRLLYKLLSYPGQIYTRQQILDDIWGDDGYVDSHTLDVHVSRLRERFKNNHDFSIVTIRGLGYKVDVNA
ncbi:MAG: response regulator transcription factor [Lachnospiraceae bacterium]|nr:response regulator transcription factor [Lachnospiraceae bacterium]